MPHRRVAAIIITTALLTAPLTTRAQVPEGSEFAVNTYTTGYQYHPSVGMDDAGNFVVVWGGASAHDAYGIHGRRFDASGNPLGELEVNSYTTGIQSGQVAMDGSGNFVVVWGGPHPDDADGGIVAGRFDSAGNSQGEFLVNASTSQLQLRPVVAMSGSGEFVVVWESFQEPDLTGDNIDLFGQRFSTAGAAVGSEFRVNSYTTGIQERSSVWIDGEGRFLVVWESRGQDGHQTGVFAQAFDGSGPVGSELQVNTYTTWHQSLAKVSGDGAGGFVVVWRDNGELSTHLNARRIDVSGAPVGAELLPVEGGGSFHVVSAPGQGFRVIWDQAGDGQETGVFARSFDSSGEPAGEEIQVNTYTTGAQYGPVAALNANGQLVVAWVSYAQDGDVHGVYARRFATPTATVTPTPTVTATPTATPTPTPFGVSIVDNNFSPARVTIGAGAKVRWTNTGSFVHTTTHKTATPPPRTTPRWDSGNRSNGQTYTVQFDEPGTYTYVCKNHAGMTGTIVVTGTPTPTSTPTATPTATPEPTVSPTPTETAVPVVQFKVANVSGAEASGSATITVTRTGTDGSTTVQYATSNGSATSPADYAAKSGTLAFNPGIASKNFKVTLVNDTKVEGLETVNLTLSNVEGGVLGERDTSTLKIQDNDGNAIFLASKAYTVTEGTAKVALVIQRTGSLSGTATVKVSTVDETALSGSDFTGLTHKVITLGPNVASKNVSVTITDDPDAEEPETFKVKLTMPTGATLGTQRTAVVTIADNDGT